MKTYVADVQDWCGNNDGWHTTVTSEYTLPAGSIVAVPSSQQIEELRHEIAMLERDVAKLARQLRKQRYRKVD